MQILNPCKKCLVKMMCRTRCPEMQDFWNTREKFFDRLGKLGVTSSVLVIIITILYYNE